MFSRGLIQIPNACGCSNPRTQDEEEKTDNVWMKGHAGNYPPIPHVSPAPHSILVIDHTSFTAIWSQPVTALQIKDWDGQWRYVRHFENALVSRGLRSPSHSVNLLFRS